MLAVSSAPGQRITRRIYSCLHFTAPGFQAERGELQSLLQRVCVCVSEKLQNAGSGCLSCYGISSERGVFLRQNAHSSPRPQEPVNKCVM